MYGYGPNSPEYLYDLVVRCENLEDGSRELNLFLIVNYGEGETQDFENHSAIVLYGTGTTADAAVERAVNPSDPLDPRRDWFVQLAGNKTAHFVWSPDEAREEIITSLLAGAPWLALKVVYSPTVTETYRFDATGFAAATREVREQYQFSAPHLKHLDNIPGQQAVHARADQQGAGGCRSASGGFGS